VNGVGGGAERRRCRAGGRPSLPGRRHPARVFSFFKDLEPARGIGPRFEESRLSAFAQPQSKRRSEHVGLFVEPQLRAQLERAARENERSMSAEVRVALKRHLNRPEGHHE
jgi:hypothetical protein